MTARPTDLPVQPSRTSRVVCVGCTGAAARERAATEKADAFAERIVDLERRIETLTLDVNRKPILDRDYAELNTRAHGLAQQEADQRHRAEDLERESRRIKAEVVNLRLRFVAIGVTP